MSSAMTPNDLYEELAREMAMAVAALLGESATVTPAPSTSDTAWIAELTVQGALVGTVRIGISETDGRRMSALVMGFEPGDVPDDAVLDTLREIASQAIGARSQAAEAGELTLTIARVERGTLEQVAAAWQFGLPGGFDPVIALDGTLEPGTQTAAAVPADVPIAADLPVAAAPTAVRNLDLLLDMELPLSVRFGQAELTLQTLTGLGPGSVIDLHRSADEPVEVLVSGKVIARGEVVVVDGNYGVRVTEVVSAAERIRSLGA